MEQKLPPQENETIEEKKCKVSGIYLIRNLVNNKIYIGSAVNIKNRWYRHKNQLTTNKHKNPYLQSAWNKYGIGNFSFEIVSKLHFIDKNKELSKQHILANEQIYLDLYESYKREKGYNINRIAGNSLGLKHSEESKIKMREFQNRPEVIAAKRNRIPWNKDKHLSKECIEKMRNRTPWNKGKHMSEKTKEKLSEINRGSKNPRYGKYNGHPISESTRNKLSILLKGKKPWNKELRGIIHQSAKARETNRLAHLGSKNHMYGKSPSTETRKKLSIKNKGQIPWNKEQKLSEEHRKKIGEKTRENHRKLGHKTRIPKEK